MTKIVLPRPPERYDPAVEAQRNLILEQALARGSGGGAWGTITGTLSAQTDLQAALDAKLDDSQATAFGLSLLGAADAPAARGLLGANNNWTVVTANTTMVAGTGYLSASATSDPFVASVTSLLNFNGANGSTTFTDGRGLLVWTANGNAQISTAQSQFGGASGAFDGAGDFITTPYSAGSLQFSGDFTIEFWTRLTSKNQAFPCLVNNYSAFGANGGLAIFADHNSATPGRFSVAFNGTFPAITSSVAISYGTWQHVALVRSGSTLTLYIGGVNAGTATSSATVTGTGDFWWIGAAGDGTATSSINGFIDDFRITRGVARYTSAFTPPTSQLELTGFIDYSVPAPVSPGDFFAVNAAVGGARVLPGAGRRIGTAGVGTAVSLTTGQTLRIVARNATQLDIV